MPSDGEDFRTQYLLEIVKDSCYNLLVKHASVPIRHEIQLPRPRLQAMLQWMIYHLNAAEVRLTCRGTKTRELVALILDMDVRHGRGRERFKESTVRLILVGTVHGISVADAEGHRDLTV